MTNGPIIPKDIANPDRIDPMMPVGSSDNPRDAGSFQTLMQKQAEMPSQAKPGGQLSSPFELAQTGAPHLATGPNLATIQTQVVHAQTTLGDINGMLTTPNLKVKPSSKYILRNKLTEASQHVRTVNAKLGGKEVSEEESEIPAGSGPIQKFLSYVGGSQAALANAQDRLNALAAKGDQMNPAEFLFVQVKMNKAQQLLDYSSVLLAKAIDDMKQIFGVQL